MTALKFIPDLYLRCKIVTGNEKQKIEFTFDFLIYKEKSINGPIIVKQTFSGKCFQGQ